MSNFTLPEDALTRISAQVNVTGRFNHSVRSPWGGHQAQFSLQVERDQVTTTCTVEMGGERHSITVQNDDQQRHILVADLIDAIANGRVDSGALAPARVTRLPVLPEPDPLLDAGQEAALRLLVRKGGTLDLHMGFAHPIKVAVHRKNQRIGCPDPGITALLSIGETQPRTICWTAYDRAPRLYARLAESVEKLTIAATPAAARCA